MKSFTLWLDVLPPSANTIKRWMTDDRREFYALVAKAKKQLDLPTFTVGVCLDIVLVWPSRRVSDPDNRIKVLTDSLVRCGVLLDDNRVYAHVHYAYEQSEVCLLKPEYQNGGVLLRVTEAPKHLARHTAQQFGLAPRGNSDTDSRPPSTTSGKRRAA